MRRGALTIANTTGLPGTAGMLVSTVTGVPFVLTNHHVAFGSGAGIGDRVWAIAPAGHGHDGVEATCLGRTIAGQIGRIAFNGGIYFVDCALVEIEREEQFPGWLTAALERLWVTESIEPVPGLAVFKEGATTGRTDGLIADIAYCDRMDSRAAPRKRCQSRIVREAARSRRVSSSERTLRYSSRLLAIGDARDP